MLSCNVGTGIENHHHSGSGRASIQVLLANLKACSRIPNLERGKKVHEETVECGHDSNIFIASALINMYAKCGSMLQARHLFDTSKFLNVVSWNALIRGYADNGQGFTALDLFTRMRIGGPVPDSVTFMAALKACIVLGGDDECEECRNWPKAIHNLIVENGCSSNINLQNTLIDTYAKCNSMVESRQVFDKMKNPDVVSWTALILGYAENGEGMISLDLFTRMKLEGPAPNKVTFVAAFTACISLTASGWECRHWGSAIHNVTVEYGCNSDIYLQTTLLNMYAKCGSMAEARLVYDSMEHPDVVPFNVLILGYVDNGQALTALEFFTKKGLSPDPITFVAVLKACTFMSLKEGPDEWLNPGKAVHNLTLDNGCNSNIYVQNTLVDMYANFGCMRNAGQVFDNMQHPTLISYTAMILGYAENGKAFAALELFTKMKEEGLIPDFVALVAALKACAVLGALEFGMKVHSEIDRSMKDLNFMLVTALVDFYAKCGCLVEAQSVFDFHAERRDVITWNTLLRGFSSCGDDESVFKLFQQMQDSGFWPDGVTFLCILTCCSHSGLVDKGKECFDEMSTKYGIIPTLDHYTCMIDVYGRANRLDDAMAAIGCMDCSPDVVTWTPILCACRRWKNVGIGSLSFKSWIKLKDRDAAAYLLMEQIYASRSMLQEQQMIMGMRKRLKTAWKTPPQTCWTDDIGGVHAFYSEP